MPDASTTETAKPTPALKLNFLSHGTLESRDLAFSRQFYEEFLGLEVVQTSDISIMVRLGGTHCIAVVFTKRPSEMGLLNHNGLDVETQEEVDAAYQVTLANPRSGSCTKSPSPCYSTAPTASISGMPTTIAGRS